MHGEAISMWWGDRYSGGGSAGDQESGGKGRQLATSVSTSEIHVIFSKMYGYNGGTN